LNIKNSIHQLVNLRVVFSFQNMKTDSSYHQKINKFLEVIVSLQVVISLVTIHNKLRLKIFLENLKPTF